MKQKDRKTKAKRPAVSPPTKMLQLTSAQMRRGTITSTKSRTMIREVNAVSSQQTHSQQRKLRPLSLQDFLDASKRVRPTGEAARSYENQVHPSSQPKNAVPSSDQGQLAAMLMLLLQAAAQQQAKPSETFHDACQ